MIVIRPYQEPDFNRLAEIHDAARRQELAAASLSCAFVPFVIASKEKSCLLIRFMLRKRIRKSSALSLFMRMRLAGCMSMLHGKKKASAVLWWRLRLRMEHLRWNWK